MGYVIPGHDWVGGWWRRRILPPPPFGGGVRCSSFSKTDGRFGLYEDNEPWVQKKSHIMGKIEYVYAFKKS